MRILMALMSVALIFSGMMTLCIYRIDPVETSAFVGKVTGYSVPLSALLIWGPIPLGLLGLVYAAGRRPRRR